MFLRSKRRFKDGKEHRYWSVVENRRNAAGKVCQRQVLYLGEINDSQRSAWCRAVEVFDEPRDEVRPMALFPADREAPVIANKSHGHPQIEKIGERRSGMLTSWKRK